MAKPPDIHVPLHDNDLRGRGREYSAHTPYISQSHDPPMPVLPDHLLILSLYGKTVDDVLDATLTGDELDSLEQWDMPSGASASGSASDSATGSGSGSGSSSGSTSGRSQSDKNEEDSYKNLWSPRMFQPGLIRKNANDMDFDTPGLGISHSRTPSASQSHTSQTHTNQTQTLVQTPSSSSNSHSRKSSNPNPQTPMARKTSLDDKDKRIARSLSRKSKVFLGNLSFKKPSKTTESDTHSGWGVASAQTTEPRLESPRLGGATPNLTPKASDRRGKSDSLIFAQQASPRVGSSPVGRRNGSVTNTPTVGSRKDSIGFSANTTPSIGMAFNVTQPLTLEEPRPHVDVLGHRSSNSLGSANLGTHNSSTIAASMYRTPPLTHHDTFDKVTSPSTTLGNSASVLSKRTNSYTNLEGRKRMGCGDAALMVDSNGVDDELFDSELKLRKLRLEIRELTLSKKHLVDEIEHLTVTRENLLQEVESLKHDKEKSSLSSFEIFDSHQGETNSQTSRKSSNSANKLLAEVRTEPKPKFWRIFGSNRSGGSSEDSYVIPCESTPAPNVSLTSVCERDGTEIPLVIKVCITYLEVDEDLLKAEGLYRKSASNGLVESIEREIVKLCDSLEVTDTDGIIECLRDTELLSLMQRDENAVASVLKRYLRSFSEPVFTYEVYDPLINLVKKDDLINTLPLLNGKPKDKFENEEEEENMGKLFRTTLGSVIRILQLLPEAHYETLKVLCGHICLVSHYSDTNLMNLHNLAIVFSPGLLHDQHGDKDLSDMRERYYIVEFILGHRKEIFD